MDPSSPASRFGALRSRRVALVALCAAAALFGLASVPPAAAEQAAMTFRSVTLNSDGCGVDCPQVIVADGIIEAETPQGFVDFAKRASQSRRLRSVVFMNSPGGNVVASMELGEDFRRLRATVVVARFDLAGTRPAPVSGECLAACVYALMGATRRVAPLESRIGLRRMSLASPGESAGGVAVRRLVAALASYAARMGVDPAVVERAESLTPGVLQTLSGAEIARWRLASTRP